MDAIPATGGFDPPSRHSLTVESRTTFEAPQRYILALPAFQATVLLLQVKEYKEGGSEGFEVSMVNWWLAGVLKVVPSGNQ